MKSTFNPMCVVTAVPTKTGLRFLHPKTQYDIDAYTEEIWAILAECNGYASSDEVIASAAKALDYPDIDVLTSIIDELRELGVLIDSCEYALYAHMLTQNPMHYSREMSFDEIAEYTARPTLPVFDGDLHPVSHRNTSLNKLQSARKSCRSFSEEAIGEDELGHILSMTYRAGGSQTPSAGGLYSLKLYVILMRPHGSLPAGYYEFDSGGSQLVLYREGIDREALEYAFNSDNMLYGASAIAVIGADLSRHIGKYSNRGYRYTLLEAGHAAQNMQLASTELGVGCLEYGGFQDGVLETELKLDTVSVSGLICLALGKRAEAIEDPQDLLRDLESALVGPSKPVRYVRITAGTQPWKGESFFGATALHKPGPHQHARRSYEQRFVGGTASSSVVAEIKAIAEAYERYSSGLVRVGLRAKASDLDVRWLDPNLVAPWTDIQWSQHHTLRRFDEGTEMEWVEGVSMRDGAPVMAPIDLAFYPLSAQILERPLCHEGSSSGVAAFTSEQEAFERALLELVERDSMMRTWFKRESPRQVPPYLLSLHWQRRVAYWQSQGRSTYVLDVGRYGAAVASVIIVSEGQYPCFVSGAAASLDSFEAAAAKAFHEAELVLLHLTKGRKLAKIDPMRVVHPMDHARLYSHSDYVGNLQWLWSGHETSVLPQVTTNMVELIDRLDPTVVKLSPQGAPLSVVRVLSDKLVPINFGFGTEYHSHPTLFGELDPESLNIPHFFA